MDGDMGRSFQPGMCSAVYMTRFGDIIDVDFEYALSLVGFEIVNTLCGIGENPRESVVLPVI